MADDDPSRGNRRDRAGGRGRVDEAIREALRLLLVQARARADRHPFGHLLPRHGARLELKLDLPLSAVDVTPEALDALADEFSARLDERVNELLAHAAVFVPGRVVCLRCQGATCAHSAPLDPRHVFGGYGPTGMPRFVEFGQMLLARRDPRVEDLYDEDASRLVTVELSEKELTAELLPSFRDARREYRAHGAVAAGWYRIPDETGRRQALAITIEVHSSRPRAGRRRLGINVLGVGPGGESLETLQDRIGLLPWTPAVRWGQSALNAIAAEARMPEGVLARRVEGLLGGLSRRIARVQRARDRRTQHAENRHETGARPTGMAMLDLSRAEDADILVDTRRKTLVVLGDRGRAHVFNEDGKHVTSVRYPPQTIARRRESGLWRQATAQEAALFRARAEG